MSKRILILSIISSLLWSCFSLIHAANRTNNSHPHHNLDLDHHQISSASSFSNTDYYISRFLSKELTDNLKYFRSLIPAWRHHFNHPESNFNILLEIEVALVSIVLPALPPLGQKKEFQEACLVRKLIIEKFTSKEGGGKILSYLCTNLEPAVNLSNGISRNLLGDEEELTRPLQFSDQLTMKEINEPILRKTYYHLLRTIINRLEIRNCLLVKAILARGWLKAFASLLYSPDAEEQSIVANILGQILCKVIIEHTSLTLNVLESIQIILNDGFIAFNKEQTRVNSRPLRGLIYINDLAIKKLWMYSNQAQFLVIYKQKLLPLIQYDQQDSYLSSYEKSCTKLLQYCHKYGARQLAREISEKIMRYANVHVSLSKDPNQILSTVNLVMKLFAEQLLTGNTHLSFFKVMFNLADERFDFDPDFLLKLLKTLNEPSVLQMLFYKTDNSVYEDFKDRQDVILELFKWTTYWYLGVLQDQKIDTQLRQLVTCIIVDKVIVDIIEIQPKFRMLVEMIREKLLKSTQSPQFETKLPTLLEDTVDVNEDVDYEELRKTLESLEEDLKLIEEMLEQLKTANS